MARFSLRNIAREDDDTTLISDDAGEAVLAEIVDSPEGDITAAASTAQELDELDAVIEGGQGDADALDSVADSLEASQDTGGIGEQAAEAISILVGRLAQRHEMPLHASGRMFATEGFGKTARRRTATESALDTVKDFGKRIWAWIVEAYKKAKEWVLKWWKNFFDGATKLKNRAEKLKKLAGTKEGALDPKAKITSDKIAEELRVNGAAPSPEQVITAATSLETLATNSVVANAAEELGKTIEALIASDAKADFDEKVGQLSTSLIKAKTGLGGVQFDVTDLDALAQEQFPGEVYSVLTCKKPSGDSSEAVAERVGSARIKIMTAKNHKPLLKTEMAAATKDQVTTICDKITSVAAKLTAGEKWVKELTKSADQTIAFAKKAAGQAKDDAKTRANLARKLASASLSISTAGFSASRQAVLAKANAALNFAAASLNEHGKKSDDTAAADGGKKGEEGTK